MFAQLLQQRLVIAEARHHVDHHIRFSRRKSGEETVALAPAFVNVVIASKTDNARPPHARRLSGYVLHQLQQLEGVFTTSSMFDTRQIGMYVRIFGFGFIFGCVSLGHGTCYPFS